MQQGYLALMTTIIQRPHHRRASGRAEKQGIPGGRNGGLRRAVAHFLQSADLTAGTGSRGAEVRLADLLMPSQVQASIAGTNSPPGEYELPLVLSEVALHGLPASRGNSRAPNILPSGDRQLRRGTILWGFPPRLPRPPMMTAPDQLAALVADVPRRGRGRRYPASLRHEIVAAAADARAQGESLARIQEQLGGKRPVGRRVQLLAVRAGVEDEVVGPDPVGTRTPARNGRRSLVRTRVGRTGRDCARTPPAACVPDSRRGSLRHRGVVMTRQRRMPALRHRVSDPSRLPAGKRTNPLSTVLCQVVRGPRNCGRSLELGVAVARGAGRAVRADL